MKTDDLEAIFARIRTWPPEWQAEASSCLQSIEKMMAGNGRIYLMTDEERADIEAGLAEEERGEFATEEEIARVFRRER